MCVWVSVSFAADLRSATCCLNKPVNGILGNGKEFQFGLFQGDNPYQYAVSHGDTQRQRMRERHIWKRQLILVVVVELVPSSEHHTIEPKILVLECNKMFIFCFVRFDTSFIVGLVIVCRRSTDTHTHSFTYVCMYMQTYKSTITHMQIRVKQV